MTGVVVVLIVLALATVFGVWRKRNDGAVRVAPADNAEAAAPPALSAEELGARLGAKATLVQFSTAFCQPCRAARGTLSHIADTEDGVAHVEIDAEHNLELVRTLGIMRTPTTLILDGNGQVVGRATGVPRVVDVRDVLARV